jgi:alpha-beta hydrolase superfamily lysophospholipase
VSSFDDYLNDIENAYRFLCSRHPGRQILPVGHSQGGLLVLLLAEKNLNELPGVIVSSPFLGIHPDSQPSAIVMVASKVLSRVAPKMMFATTADPVFLSRDPKVGKDYAADPLVSDKVSARWATSLMEAHREVLAGAPNLEVPALVMQAGADRLVDPDATRTWVASAPQKLVEYVEWKGYYHEIFNEPELERRPVFERMDQWLAAHQF